MIILGINAYHGDAAACLSWMGNSSPRQRRNAFAASNTGRDFLVRQSAIVCLYPVLTLTIFDVVAINQDAARISGENSVHRPAPPILH